MSRIMIGCCRRYVSSVNGLRNMCSEALVASYVWRLTEYGTSSTTAAWLEDEVPSSACSSSVGDGRRSTTAMEPCWKW